MTIQYMPWNRSQKIKKEDEKMKTARKICSFVFVIVMILAMSIPAAATGTGSIIVTNATTGKDYSVYKVFDLTYTGNNVAYTYTKNGASDALFTALSTTTGDNASPFTLTATTNADIYNVSISATADAIAEWLKNNEFSGMTVVLRMSVRTMYR